MTQREYKLIRHGLRLMARNTREAMAKIYGGKPADYNWFSYEITTED